MSKELRAVKVNYEEASEERTEAPRENGSLRHRDFKVSHVAQHRNVAGGKSPPGPATGRSLTSSLTCYLHSRHV